MRKTLKGVLALQAAEAWKGVGWTGDAAAAIPSPGSCSRGAAPVELGKPDAAVIAKLCN